MKRKLFVFVALSLCAVDVMAQSDTLTLKRCIEMGIERNLGLQEKQQDIRIADIGKSENRHKLIPVIQGYANFTHNANPAKSVTDGTNLGRLLGVDAPYMVSKGLEWQHAMGVTLSMPLYNQTLYTGIKIADKMADISRASYEKAKEDLIMEISQLYYLAQTTAKQIELIRGNIVRMEELKNITTAFYDNQMVLEVDVQRVDINLENLRTALTNAEAMYEQQLNLLRYTLDLAPETPMLLSAVNTNISYENNYLSRGLSSDLYELQILDMQSDVLLKKKKMINQGYIPSINLVGGASWSAYTDDFRHWFHSHQTNKLYNHTYWGVQLNIPIFDGLAKHNKVRKANAEYARMQTTIADTKSKLQTQYQNSLNDWYNNVRNAERQQENYRLAESVYLVTSDQYKEGVASMSDLLQDELRMTEAQNGYISALYKYMVSELSLLKLTGQLDRLTE